jgi:broad specificity phosphatase PhoE
MKILKDTRLRERFLGKLQGLPIPDDWDDTNYHESTESMPELYERAKDFISHLQSSCQNRTVLVVSHGITLKVLISICLGYDESQLNKMDDLANCSTCIFEKTPTEFLLVTSVKPPLKY